MNQYAPVYVLGAGFTKAFLPSAPLLRDDYNLDALIDRFPARHFPTANRILMHAQSTADGLVDLERLMTRLQGGMPYDAAQGAVDETAMLLREVKILFKERLLAAKEAESPSIDVLRRFARRCLDGETNIITFNYDDLLDEALFAAGDRHASEEIYEWHPNGSYGFFCRPAYEIAGEDIGASPYRGASTMLKLHGSLNWQIKKGSPSPHAVDAFVHYEAWLPPEAPSLAGVVDHFAFLSRHLEAEPFIVPPTMNKSDIMREPLLNSLWSSAFDTLHRSLSVTFVGYSMPVTDLAAASLFREAIRRDPDARVRVINWVDPNDANAEEKKQQLKRSYREVLEWIPDDFFDFRGAVVWAADPPA